MADEAQGVPIFEQTLRQSAARGPLGGLLGLVDAVPTSKPKTDIREENVPDKNNCIVEEGCLATFSFPAVKIVDGKFVEAEPNLSTMLFSFFLLGETRDRILNTPNSVGVLKVTASRDLGRNMLADGSHEPVGITPTSVSEFIPVKSVDMMLGDLFKVGPASLNNCPANPPGNVDMDLNVVDPNCGLNGHTDVTKTDSLLIPHDTLVGLILGSGGAEPGTLDFTLDLDAPGTPGRLKIFGVTFVVDVPQPSTVLLLGAALLGLGVTNTGLLWHARTSSRPRRREVVPKSRGCRRYDLDVLLEDVALRH